MSWLGAALVVFASWACGIALAKDEGKSVKALESLISMLSYMRRRMMTEREPLYEIFAQFDDDFLQGIGFLDIIRSHRNGICGLWMSATDTLDIDKETKKELLHFGESLGAIPLDEQIKRLDELSLFLIERRNDLRQSLPKKQKSIKTVCILFGLMIAIILI